MVHGIAQLIYVCLKQLIRDYSTYMASTRIAEATAQEIALVREFNRFYTRQIGVLQEVCYRAPIP